MTAINKFEAAVIVAAADCMVPGNKDWPTPSETDLGRFITEAATRPDDLKALRKLIRFLGTEFGSSDTAVQAEALRAFERENPGDFRVVIDFVYCGYYSRPEVVRAIQRNFDCDYISPPQPRGYNMPLEPDLLPPKRGKFTPTEQVKRVDLSKLSWLSDEINRGSLRDYSPER